MRLALLLVVALQLAGAGLLIWGICLLAGAPWALIAAGVALLCACLSLRSGLING